MNFKKMLSIIMVVVMCLTLFSGCGGDKNNGDTTTTSEPDTVAGKTIAFVSGSESMGFYSNLKKGAEDAAKKYGFKLDYIGIDDSESNDTDTQIKNLQKALENDVSGVVVTPVGNGYSDILSKFYDKNIPVTQIDSITRDDVEDLESKNKNPIVSTIITDYKQAGAICAEKVFEKVKEDIKNEKNVYIIGIIERDDNSYDEEKSKGFIEKFTELADSDESIKGKYKIETEDGADALEELVTEEVKAIFITHPEIADKISDTVSADKEKYKEITFCGFDSGAKQMKWLQGDINGKFIGGVAQDSYNLGYNAVDQCIFSIQGKEVKADIKIDVQWYDKTNAEKMKQNKFVYEK